MAGQDAGRHHGALEDDDLRETVQEVLAAVDGIFGTRVSFVSRFEGDRFHVLDAIDREEMGFDPGLDVDLADTF